MSPHPTVYNRTLPVLLTVSLLTLFTISCSMKSATTVSSPDHRLSLTFSLSGEGHPQYSLRHNGTTVIDTSALGFAFRNQPPLLSGLQVVSTAITSYNERWQPVWGEQREIHSNYKELLVKLEETEAPGRTFRIRFRLFDDGLGFRYEFPAQEALGDSVHIMNEHTRFRLTGDHTAWWIPADYDSYEYNYQTTKVSGIDASRWASENERVDRQIDNFRAVNTPVTMKTGGGLYLSFHEADLTDYAGMTLAVRDDLTLESELVPWPDGVKVRTAAPFHTPWRTVQVAESPAGLRASSLLLNLNEPSKLDDTSWIEPMKYTGIWWEMHIGKTGWGMQRAVEGSFGNTQETPHGATTENAKRYIDFNARAGIRGLLIEGWNTGWEYWGADTVGFFDFTTPYPDFDLREVVRYADARGVALIGHHETSGQAAHYESRLEEAFKLYNTLGIHAVKTGYAGGIVPKGQYHHGQYMVRHYRTVLETAARYQIALNAHEPIKPTGIRRTWPNMMTREGVRGMEYNAWSEGTPPEHTTILPFTRGLGGPIDYTPGIFDILFDEYRDKEQVHATLANQLALYVVLYSPMQMAADLPENYLRNGGGFHPMFEFIREVPVNWDESVYLESAIGDYVSVARKDRDSDRWFLGAVTDEQARTLSVTLDFLDNGRSYTATLYRDGPRAHWQSNPTSWEIKERGVTAGTVLELPLAPGGGAAVSFKPAE